MRAAALLFVVLEQLIVEAHEAATAPPLAASLFAGFLLIMVLGMLS
jgi:ZIP family zinc transporter